MSGVDDVDQVSVFMDLIMMGSLKGSMDRLRRGSFRIMMLPALMANFSEDVFRLFDFLGCLKRNANKKNQIKEQIKNKVHYTTCLSLE